MKKKLIALLSICSLFFVSFNSVSCSKDDDDDKKEMKDAAAQGKEDGEAFAQLYNEAKEAGFTSETGISNIAKMFTSAKKYRNSEDRVYKSSYIAAASGATGLAEDKVESLLGSESISAITNLIKVLAGGSNN